MKNTKTFALSIPPELVEKLDEMTKLQHCSRSYLLCCILREFFIRHENDSDF